MLKSLGSVHNFYDLRVYALWQSLTFHWQKLQPVLLVASKVLVWPSVNHKVHE